MRNGIQKGFYSKIILLLLGFCVLGCSTSKTDYKHRYAKAWKEVIKSEAWKNALLADNNTESAHNMNLYSSTGEVLIIEDDKPLSPIANVAFVDRYNSLVSRAYVKIIVEAEKANDRLKSEYELWSLRNLDPNVPKGREFKKDFNLISRRYHAHKEMLEGLRSWNIFSKYGTDDLKFFKKENIIEVHSMIQKGKSDNGIIEFLIYKLADLYHFDS